MINLARRSFFFGATAALVVPSVRTFYLPPKPNLEWASWSTVAKGMVRMGIKSRYPLEIGTAITGLGGGGPWVVVATSTGLEEE